LCCLIWFTMIIYGASFAKETLRRPKVQSWVERISGLALVGFGIRLAMEKNE